MNGGRLSTDHLVYAAADVEAASEVLAERLGVRPAGGGSHVGLGTRNALLSLGGDVYLEVIGPDPEQDFEHRPGRFSEEPLLRGWAVGAPGIDAAIAATRARGYDPGDAEAMSRARPDGVLLEWRLTPPGRGSLAVDDRSRVVPFLIDWGDSEHPSRSAPVGCRLVALRAEHPQPGAARARLDAIGVELDVTAGAEAALIATIDTPDGRVELR